MISSSMKLHRQPWLENRLQTRISELADFFRDTLGAVIKGFKLTKLFTAGTTALAALPGAGIYFGLGIGMPWLAAAVAAGLLAALLASQLPVQLLVPLPSHRYKKSDCRINRQNALQSSQDHHPVDQVEYSNPTGFGQRCVP
ncbi:hypothetical protein [Nitrosospira multiformis]|uniref:Uncharacterized protein n=2 Tax=Nitrosospira multiformis (strain ATCC 25196 / NCIMB 11849 / C 71) TaxID=323848 RepID=Q2Y8X0_NITMU|nr:hypothetical protein [Nitrosospira multiformis]ABB74801.1 hypothetical protein Nmul_A1498 [Nitrosospira multiformis ATCC 25196]